MRKLEWRTEKRKVNDLLPFRQNPRKMSEKQASDLIKSLKKYGIVEPPVIDVDGKICAGHQRIACLQLMGKGEEAIDCRVPSRKLTEKEYKGYLITSNKVTGDWDYSLLSEYFDIDTLTESGFDDSEIADVFADTLEADDDGFDVADEIKRIKKPKSKIGDLYLLGPHKIICGDSTDLRVVKRLVGKKRVDVIYCDPIFNLNLPYKVGLGGKANYGGNVNDKRTDAEYREFLRKSIANALSVAKQDCHVFYFCDQKYIGLLQELYKSLGVENKRVCLWIKGPMNPVPQVAFGKCYEPIVYGIQGKPFLSRTVQNLSEIMNQEMTTGNELLEQITELFDIWINKRVAGQKYIHATEKPISLHTKPFKRCSKPGDIILDLFSGSSSSLIAAEQMKRVAYVAELEPLYVDLALRRFTKLTGIKPKKIYAQ